MVKGGFEATVRLPRGLWWVACRNVGPTQTHTHKQCGIKDRWKCRIKENVCVRLSSNSFSRQLPWKSRRSTRAVSFHQMIYSLSPSVLLSFLFLCFLLTFPSLTLIIVPDVLHIPWCISRNPPEWLWNAILSTNGEPRQARGICLWGNSTNLFLFPFRVTVCASVFNLLCRIN